VKNKAPLQELLEWIRSTLPMDLDTPRMIEEKIISLVEKELKQSENSQLCPHSDGWFKRYLSSYVKEASTIDLFIKLKNVTKQEYLPLIEEIIKRYNKREPRKLDKMTLQKGDEVIVNGCIWDAPVTACYDYKNAKGIVTKVTHGWPVININGTNALIAWDHITKVEQ